MYKLDHCDILYIQVVMKYIEKQKALKLRMNGESIKVIAKKLGVSNASVSFWVRDIKLNNRQIKILSKRGFSVEAIEKRREKRIFNEKIKRKILIDKAKEDIINISNKELLIIGSMLYLGEGGKTKRMVRISNSDPDVIRIMMKFFRVVCHTPEDKFRGHLHIHSHLKIKKAEKYWSDVSKIPTSQFFKTYSKPSVASLGKKDSIPNGTFEVHVNDVKVFLFIMGWIEKIKELII